MRHLMPPYQGGPNPTTTTSTYFSQNVLLLLLWPASALLFFCQCYNSQSCRGCFSCGKGNLSGNWSWGGGRQEIHGDLNWWQFSGECRSQLRQSITRKKITKSTLRLGDILPQGHFAPRTKCPKTKCPKDILPQDILPQIAQTFGRWTYCPNCRIMVDILPHF